MALEIGNCFWRLAIGNWQLVLEIENWQLVLDMVNWFRGLVTALGDGEVVCKLDRDSIGTQ